MTWLGSLKARLIGVAAVWILIGVVAAGVMLAAVFRKHVTDQFKEELYVHLSELQRLAQVHDGDAVLVRPLSDPRYENTLSGFYWEIQKGENVLARSSSLQGPRLSTPLNEAKDVGVHLHMADGPTGPILVAEQAHWKTPSGPVIRYVIGTDQRHIDAVLAEFNRTLAIALAAFAAALILAAALLIAFAMRPFAQLRLALGRIRQGEEKQIKETFPGEVQPLVDDLNSLLVSTGDLVQRARTQAGNVAHGLKTPMAILADEADRLARDGITKSAATIAAQIRKMQAHIDYQITRARAAAAHVTIGNSASVAVCVDEVTHALQRLYRARSLAIEHTVDPELRVVCDRQDLNEILANLVDNACKHAKSRVEISADASAGGRLATIRIDDDGPGLPIEARELVFNVGERWDSQEPGSGLGLAIVRDLTRLYAGDIALNPSPLGGLQVLLTLPVRTSA